MPIFEIQGPDGVVYEVDAPNENAALKAFGSADQPSSQSGYGDSYFAQTTSGGNEGIANMIGFPVDMMNSIVNLGVKGINAVAGTDLQASDKPFLGSEQIKGWMEDAGSIHPETDDPGKQFARRVGQEVGASIIPGLGTARSAKDASRLAASVIGSGTGAATAQQLFPDNPYAEAVGQLVGGGLTAGAISRSAKKRAGRKIKDAIPSTEKLFDDADVLYDKADARGIVAGEATTKKIVSDIRRVAVSEGLVSPKGRIARSYPKIADVIDSVSDYQKSMSVKQMKIIRKSLTNAAKSGDASERRIAMKMLDGFMDNVNPLAPEISEANKLYHAASKARTLDVINDLAGSRAGQFSGSGYENALRTEYRGMERKIIKGQEKGWTPAEKRAITDVAQGTRASNAARNVGRFAPTGVVSAGGTFGVPYLIGNSIGGPALGAAFGGIASGTGYAGRALATKMGINNATKASELVRNRGPIQSAPAVGEDIMRVITALLAAQAANLPEQR